VNVLTFNVPLPARLFRQFRTSQPLLVPLFDMAFSAHCTFPATSGFAVRSRSNVLLLSLHTVFQMAAALLHKSPGILRSTIQTLGMLYPLARQQMTMLWLDVVHSHRYKVKKASPSHGISPRSYESLQGLLRSQMPSARTALRDCSCDCYPLTHGQMSGRSQAQSPGHCLDAP